MKVLRGRVAVVTGAASGIGRGLAERFAAEGMRLVLADIEEEPLRRAEHSLRTAGAEVIAVPTDVSDPDQVDRLASRSLEAFGRVQLVCNNAGVGVLSAAPLWEMSRADWEWVVGVNLWGVINGIRAFVPILLEQEEGHVVNTASMAGLTTATLGIYSVTKHAIVALSEALFFSLVMRGARVGVSVLCPGWVQTNIMNAERNRPLKYRTGSQAEPAPEEAAVLEFMKHLVATGAPPAKVAARVVEAIHEDRFYVVPQPELLPMVRQRMEDILEGRTPTPIVPGAPAPVAATRSSRS